MRSLFHLPLPAQPPSQQPSHCSQKCAAARILHPCAAPQRCFPPPARSQAPRLPPSISLSPAPRAPAMPRPHPCLAPLPVPIAPHHLSTTPLLPAPFGLASSASRPSRAVARIASTPLRAAIRIPLCRHRADSALIAPPITTIVRRRRLTRVALRRPHRAHRAPTSASPPHLSPRVAAAPGPWLARTAPYASLFRRMREKGPLPGNIRPKCMLFEIKMATSSPHASISGRNRAIQDAWRANLAAKGPFSRRGARNHAWREDVASAARPFSGSGLRSGGTGFAPCDSGMRHAAWPNGLCALRRGPGLLAACAPPAISLVPAAARVHRRRLICVALRRPHRAHRAPPSAAPPIAVGVSADRALPAALVLPAPMHLATCAPHPSRQPRGPTASRKQAEQRKQLNAGIKIGSPNGDPIE